VCPSLDVIATASEAPLLRTFEAPLNVVEPPLLPESAMPPPASLVSAMLPLSVTPAPVRLVISAVAPVPLSIAPA
jgi:hypothetical protein